MDNGGNNILLLLSSIVKIMKSLEKMLKKNIMMCTETKKTVVLFSIVHENQNVKLNPLM